MKKTIKVFGLLLMMISMQMEASATIPPGAKAVDLGLPSGTLWANMNVGSQTREETSVKCGSYFSWGETTPKGTYGKGNYKFYNNFSQKLTKYCVNSNEGNVDNKKELDPEDDAATVNWGKPWRTPSHDQFRELVEECTWETENDMGVKVIGPNGNYIFLPAIPHMIEERYIYGGEYLTSVYWTRTLDTNNTEQNTFARTFTMDKGYITATKMGFKPYLRTSEARFHGLMIRPVCSKKAARTTKPKKTKKK